MLSKLLCLTQVDASLLIEQKPSKNMSDNPEPDIVFLNILQKSGKNVLMLELESLVPSRVGSSQMN